MTIKTTWGFLKVPFRMAPLLVILVFGVLFVLALKATLLGIPLGLLLFTGFLNYTFALLDSVIAGESEPPVLSIEMMNPVSAPRSLVLLAMLVVVFFCSQAGAYWFGTIGAVIAGLACATLLPALLAVQAATGSTPQALNVITAVRLMGRLGNDYLVIVGFVVAAVLIGSGIFELKALPLVLRVAVAMYLWLASFCLIGGVLRERAQDIGLEDAWEPDSVEADADAHEQRRRAQFVDRIYAEWRGGAHENAWKSVMIEVGTGSDALERLEWLYGYASRWPDPRLANRLAHEILPRLLAARRNGEAVDIARAQLRADPLFRPLASSDLLNLAALARAAGDRPTARALLQDFDRYYPGDPARSSAMSLIQQLER